MGNPLLALQIESMDIQPAANALAAGLDRRFKTQAAEAEKNVLARILGPALQPGGDMGAAASAAMAANRPDLGLKLFEMAQDQRAKLADSVAGWAYGVKDPEEWARGLDVIGRRFGQDLSGDYGDFESGRELLLSEAWGADYPKLIREREDQAWDRDFKERQLRATTDNRANNLETIFTEDGMETRAVRDPSAPGGYRQVGGTKAPTKGTITETLPD